MDQLVYDVINICGLIVLLGCFDLCHNFEFTQALSSVVAIV